MPGLTLVAILLAQAAPAIAPGTMLRALDVSVADSKGAAITDLATSDVALLENGVTRDVTSFALDRRPLWVALLVDSSASVGSDYRLSLVDAVRELVARFPPGTRYSVWTTGDRPAKVLDFTDDRAGAAAALGRVAPQGGNTILDALSEAGKDLDEHAKEGDRTVVVAITGTGPEFSSRDKYRSADEARPRASLFLAAQVDAGDGDFEIRTNIAYVLDRLTSATGGRYEVALSWMGIDSALRKLSATLLGSYRLVYATEPDLKKRKLELRVARPGAKVLVPAAPAP